MLGGTAKGHHVSSLTLPAAPQNRDAVTRVGHSPPHIPVEPSALAAVVQLVMEQGAGHVCSGALSTTQNLSLCFNKHTETL